MRTEEVDVRNEHGLHARPAAIFVRAAAGFKSRITVDNLSLDGRSADAKSLITLLSAGVSRGHRIRIAAEGEDENEAVEALRGLVASGIGEAVE